MAHGSSAVYPILAPRSRLYQGPYGRLFPELHPWSPEGVPPDKVDAWFREFAEQRMTEAPGVHPGEIARNPELRAQLEAAFGSTIPAGYTYFGQFIDHDVTFDPASSLVRQNDPSGLYNFRTPRLDLDSVYGRGPSDQPYLYDQNDKAKLLIGRIAGCPLRDLPRNAQGRALIGDMRNDENAIVSQLHLAFLLAHNALVDRARDKRMSDPFEAARRTLRWLYQFVVWNDFIMRVTSETVCAAALKLEDTADGRKKWELGLKDIYSWRNQPFMPIEFSGAAYRFGHSMVRNEYQTNQPFRGAGNFVPLFDDAEGEVSDDLHGFRPIERRNVIQWDWFFPMRSSLSPFPQVARKIDSKLANALAFLPDGSGSVPTNLLAYRNLKKGLTFGLPSAREIAKQLCIEVLEPDDEIEARVWDSLWFYILREAESVEGDNAGKLGALGSTIVCATFAGLLKGDPLSYLNVEPLWEPGRDPLLCPGQDNQDDRDWTLASIIRIAGRPVNATDVVNQSQGAFGNTLCRR
jgi:hypothetical protein